MDIHSQNSIASNSLPAVQPLAAETSDSRVFAIGKRAIDVCVAIPVVCFLLPPLMVLVAVLHACVSRGPLFFRQERCGRHGEMFSILKFRTMTPAVTIEDDAIGDQESRVFLFGQWVRFSKIDEVPQFVNVLRGEMSVVGPRPHHLQDSVRFGSRVAGYKERFVVKPGITGLAQIREYAGEFRWNCTDSRVAADLDYIRTRSLVTDLSLMFRTFSTVAWKCQQKLLRSLLTISMDETSATLPFPKSDALPDPDLVAADEASRKAA